MLVSHDKDAGVENEGKQLAGLYNLPNDGRENVMRLLS